MSIRIYGGGSFMAQNNEKGSYQLKQPLVCSPLRTVRHFHLNDIYLKEFNLIIMLLKY